MVTGGSWSYTNSDNEKMMNFNNMTSINFDDNWFKDIVFVDAGQIKDSVNAPAGSQPAAGSNVVADAFINIAAIPFQDAIISTGTPDPVYTGTPDPKNKNYWIYVIAGLVLSYVIFR